MNQGIKNELKIVKSYNGKKFSELTDFQKNIIKTMFNNIKDESIIKSNICNRLSKPDIFLEVEGEVKFISIKSGITDSMHFESIKSFILFFRELGVSTKTQKILLLFHYGDGTLDGSGNKRLLFDELFIKYKEWIEFANNELSKKYIVRKCLERFVIKGIEHRVLEVDYFYYGDEKYGILCSKDDLVNFVLSRNYDHYKTLHIGPMTIQPYLRDINDISKNKYKRDIVQVKWHYFLIDLQKSNSMKNIIKTSWYKRKVKSLSK